MAAILRVKRRNSDEPLIALLVASKRRKTENDETDAKEEDSETTAVLKFAGTVKNQETDVIGQIVSTLSKDELKANYKKHSVDILDKVRQWKRQATIDKRYKVINCLRSLNTSNSNVIEEKVATLIDVEDLVSCDSTKKSDDEKNEDYVYDVYYGNTDTDLYIDESVSVHPFHQEFIYDMHRYGEDKSESESGSEDSNSESNWRNDYPDSDEDMREAVKNLRVNDDDDDASSYDDEGPMGDYDGEERYLFACDQSDVNMYGYRYAMYKAKLKEEDNWPEDADSYVDEEEEDEENDVNLCTMWGLT